MNEVYDSPIMQTVTRNLIPVVQVFGLYILVYGHYGPGGGFQAGVLLAAAVLLSRLTYGRQASLEHYPERTGVIMAGWGVFIYFLTGFVPMLLGGTYLDYSFLPLPGLDPVSLRYEGILLIEVGVTMTVGGMLVAIYDQLSIGAIKL